MDLFNRRKRKRKQRVEEDSVPFRSGRVGARSDLPSTRRYDDDGEAYPPNDQFLLGATMVGPGSLITDPYMPPGFTEVEEVEPVEGVEPTREAPSCEVSPSGPSYPEPSYPESSYTEPSASYDSPSSDS